MGEQKGFSLIEILIVVAIILIIAAIAIPNLFRSRIAANEASAVVSIHNINIAEVAYYTTYTTLGFAPDLNTLGPGATGGNNTATSTNALLLDGILGCTTGVGTAYCQKSGYNFNITTGSGTPIITYATNANPITLGQSGQRYFYSDISGVTRYNFTAAATSFDPALN